MIKEELKKKCVDVDVQNLSDIKKDKTININSKKEVYKFYENISLEKLLKIYIEYYGINSLFNLVNYYNRKNKKGVLKMNEELKELKEVLIKLEEKSINDNNLYNYLNQSKFFNKSIGDIIAELKRDIKKEFINNEEELKQELKSYNIEDQTRILKELKEELKQEITEEIKTNDKDINNNKNYTKHLKRRNNYLFGKLNELNQY